MTSEEVEDVSGETIHQTHQLLKACRQCTLLACTHLDVLKTEKTVTLDKRH